MDRTIAQTFISALHLFKTMILGFKIDHLRASRVAGTWLLARRLPSDIGRSAGDAVVRQVRSRGSPRPAKRQKHILRAARKRTARASNGLSLGLISGFGTFETCLALR